ncbi:chorismate mutase [Spirillospora sp. NBC_01491]|uniref:chorismate mutase n=1 Tax=Spirillospora sp. NBC_01491 TaxID=2976007 RepID=UPI002E33D89F|nr:chorismate mutase [Spirillospora sp. NBC_01491]
MPLHVPSLLPSLLVPLVLAVSGTPAADASPLRAEPLAPLVGLSADRLALADEVAAAKWGTATPIEDPVRERAVLDDVTARSAALGLDPDAAVRVFRDQIEAGKLVQRGLHRRWTARPSTAPSRRPDLGKEVRPALDRLTGAILAELQRTAHVRASASCAPELIEASARAGTERRLDVLHRSGLTRALPSVCRIRS